MTADKQETTEELLARYGFERPECGASVGPGWHPILEDLLRVIRGLCVIDQVKEKFGGLRVYYHLGEQELEDIDSSEASRIDFSQKRVIIDTAIRMAELAAARTCETCGKPGQRISKGWIKTLCPEHTKE